MNGRKRTFSLKVQQCGTYKCPRSNFVKNLTMAAAWGITKMKIKSQIKVTDVQVHHCLLWQVTSRDCINILEKQTDLPSFSNSKMPFPQELVQSYPHTNKEERIQKDGTESEKYYLHHL